MRSIKIVFPVLALALSQTVASQSSDRAVKTPEQKAKAVTEHMTKRLNLTEDQAGKVYELNLQRARELEPYAKSVKEARAAMNEAHKQSEEKSASDMRGVLTADQFAEWERAKAERQQRMSERRHKSRDANSKRSVKPPVYQK